MRNKNAYVSNKEIEFPDNAVLISKTDMKGIACIDDFRPAWIDRKWIKECASRRILTFKTRDTKGKLRNLYSVLELHGKDASNLADLTVRMRELRTQSDDLESALVRLEEEEMPEVSISDIEINQMADQMREVVVTTEDPKRLRAFFSQFIESIEVNDGGAVINYDRTKVMNRAGFDAVHSNETWLPDLDSNQGPAD